jgi:hypothetical protein
MTDHRAKLEALLNDSSLYKAGQQDERLRLCFLLDLRLELLGNLHGSQAAACRKELLMIRQALQDHQ